MAQMTITQFMTGIKNWVLGKIENITALIPSQASSSNQLADKAFVNSSIATATATFQGTYNVVSDLSLSYNATHAQIQTALGSAISTPDNNDYAFVQIPTADATPTQIAKIERYKYSGSAWAFEYELNNSGFTAAQWAAINSGATLELIGKLSDLPTNAELTELLAAKQNVIQDLADIRSGATAGATAVQPATLNTALSNTVAESGVYDVTANNDNAKFASLSALLSSENLDTLIPTAKRKGGMSIKFVLSSDNKYVRYNLIADDFSTDVEDWEEDASIEKLEGGDIIPKLAQNLESWEGREDLTVNSTWSEPVRTTAGDASIVSSKGGKLVSIVPRSDFYASALKATGFNLLRNAVQIEGTTKYYFLVPKLIFGTFGTADEPNGVLFTNAQGEKMTPTVYFKKLSDGVPTSSNYGSACTYTTSNGYRFYTCSEIGYMVVDGVTLASTCAHIAWSRRYDDYVAIDAAGDEGSSVSLAAIFTALHAANQPALFITNDVRDYIEFTNTTAVWNRVCNKVTVSSWTNTEVPSDGGGASTYIHSASISGMKSGGVARIGSMMLSVDGTTVSFTDSNPTASAADVVYELATQASGTVAVTPTYSLEDWGLEYLDGVTGVAEVTTQYCRNYPDSLAALAQFDFKDLSLVVGEALAELFFDVQAIKANMMRYTSLIDEYGYPVRMGQRIFDLTDGAPTEIPMSIGLVRMDASTGHVWISKSLTISTSDWKQVQ